MRNMFSYDSKLTHVLSYVADILILNILFVICCLPIFTIGAAQAGLYTATRQMINPEDDRSCIKAFFRGFASGFGQITLMGTFFLLLDLILVFTLDSAITDPNVRIHWLFPTILLVICLMVHSLLPLFHSRFGCRPSQLIRNCLLLMISHPLRSIAVLLLTWAPAAAALLNPPFFLRMGALLVMVYYGVAFLFGAFLMEKPFKLLIDDMDFDDDKDED